MKRQFYFIFFISSLAVISLQDCRLKTAPSSSNNEPDSLFEGVHYTLIASPLLPAIPNTPEIQHMTYEGVQLGRMLFYDPILSSDSAFSCSSCHKQQYAFADSGNAFSKNFFGLSKRNAPGLFNLMWMPRYFWDGRSATLPAQASDALSHEMNFTSRRAISGLSKKPVYVRLFKKAFGRPGAITDTTIEQALAEFMLTLISSESRFDSFQRGQVVLTPQEQRGYILFTTDTEEHGAGCFTCHHSNSAHKDFRFTDDRFQNNALDSSSSFTGFPDLGLGATNGNKLDNGKFKTPQLRNVALTGPYMRDGRFKTLTQVIHFYNDSLKLSPTVDPAMTTAYRGGLHYLTRQNIRDLIAFLNTLTDYRFIHNPAYSNPFH